MPWREKKYHCGGHSWQGGLFTKQFKKRVKAAFLLGCYGCIFHGTRNSAQLCQNFGISGEGGVEHPNPTPPLSVRHWLTPHPFILCQHTSVSTFGNSTDKFIDIYHSNKHPTKRRNVLCRNFGVRFLRRHAREPDCCRSG